jgi:hypothetical protein
MDPELKQALSDMENRFYQHVDARLKTTETKLNDRLDERLHAMELKFDERLEGMETKLLTAFHDWARTYEVRARGTSTAVRELDERLGLVEERIAKLERGRNGGLKN